MKEKWIRARMGTAAAVTGGEDETWHTGSASSEGGSDEEDMLAVKEM
jgi:hypothetical protein